jgi:hypothetical protein
MRQILDLLSRKEPFRIVRHHPSQTYLQIKDKAVALERLYADSEVALPDGCDLAPHIADAKSLSDHWLTDHAKLQMTLLFRAINLNRIADVVLPLQSVTEAPNISGCSRLAA